jgi:hypothetical protein
MLMGQAVTTEAIDFQASGETIAMQSLAGCGYTALSVPRSAHAPRLTNCPRLDPITVSIAFGS